MYKIAVMGDYDSIYGFATLGLDTFPVDDPEYGVTLLKRLAEDNLSPGQGQTTHKASAII